VFHVKGVNVVVRNEVRMGVAVGHFLHTFIHSGHIVVTAVDITLALYKVTIYSSDLYTVLIH
jgi:hypothetical protein